MKKLSLLFAALLTATVMNLNAATAGTTPDMHDFLYFTSLKADGAGTVRLDKYGTAKNVGNLTATFEYSKDRINWESVTWASDAEPKNTYQGNPIALAKGDTVFFRALGAKKDGKNATLSNSTVVYYNFVFGVDDQIAAGGNIMSLYDATCTQDTMTNAGFAYLFNNATQLVSAPKLPATKLATKCYGGMFNECTSLTQAPELKATALEAYCYSTMFNGCTSLTQAPELKATNLKDACYMAMFKGCTSLEVNTYSSTCDGAELEVPTVSGTAPMYWSNNMFAGCKGDAALTAQTGIQLGGHYCIKGYKDMRDFLYFTSLKADGTGTVKLNKTNANLTATFQYSKDRINWSDYTWPDNSGKGGAAIELKNVGDTVFFRAKGTNGKNAAVSTSSDNYFQFSFGADDQIAAGGNAMSLYDATCEQDTMTANGFCFLFLNAKQLVSAPKLPATRLASCCYQAMFLNCTSLTQAPELKATTLAQVCYNIMFAGCTALTKTPELKATTLAESCYNGMFYSCTSLEVDTFSNSCDGAKLEVPTVSGTAPADWNQDMFGDCKGAYANKIQLGGHYCIKEYKETYGRKLSAKGNYGTICLDKKFNKMEGVEGLFVPYEKTATMLYCEEVELKDVVAGGAYIFKADSDVVVFTLEGEAVSAAVNNDHMIGWLAADSTLNAQFYTDHADYYLLANNVITKPTEDSKILKNRAFIDMNFSAPTAPARGRLISFGLNDVNTPTGMEQVAGGRLQVAEKCMVNGQLVIIRDGKMFNAQGAQL